MLIIRPTAESPGIRAGTSYNPGFDPFLRLSPVPASPRALSGNPRRYASTIMASRSLARFTRRLAFHPRLISLPTLLRPTSACQIPSISSARGLFSTSFLRDPETKKAEATTNENESAAPEGEAKADGAKETEELTPEQATEKQIKDLEEAVKAAKEETAQMKDRLARSLAEMENVRQRWRYFRYRRLQTNIANIPNQDSTRHGKLAFAKDLLDVSDNLGRATAAVPPELLETGDEHIKALHEGVVMTEKTLHGVFERHNIIQIEALDKTFDPNLHEGMFEYEDPEKEPNTVGQVGS
eukprot:1378560-Amorphochlora_amoeboformis.AAC.2